MVFIHFGYSFQKRMALRKVKGAVERVFDKNLNDLVRGIRAHKDDEVWILLLESGS